MVHDQSGVKRPKKRLIVCCDGTWMNSDYGFVKPGLFHLKGFLQVPSNVTRISRCFKRRCSDGTIQIINYESGVGTSDNFFDNVTGGAFGFGLAERVREAYSFLCANYTDGDEIFLVGYSRGAFTARSVAGLISNLGLLTREGVEHFYPIFRDMQNWLIDDKNDPFPDNPFPDKPRGAQAASEYRSRLAKIGYTRVNQKNGQLITVKAVCVWDTWHDTALSDRIEHAFQALALDETRAPFSPAIWERPLKSGLKTDLRQVWFPGNHGNCGGGWDDQGVANLTLAWMMDQMASVGVEFDQFSLDRIIQRSVDYHNGQEMQSGRKRRKAARWAADPVYENNKPVRPWGLGSIHKVYGMLYWLSGQATRTPGEYRKIISKNKLKLEKGKFLQDTNETVHSSVRVRLACEGLGLDDKSVWTCPALGKWRLQRVALMQGQDPHSFGWQKGTGRDHFGEEVEVRWMWRFVGDDDSGPTDPQQRIMWEEPLGPYEKYLVQRTGGTPNVHQFSERRALRFGRLPPPPPRRSRCGW